MTDLYCESIGAGPAVLMMHGLGLDHTYLRPWHDPLADSHRVIYYDHRDCGRSPREAGLDHARWHADAAALLDDLGEPRATIYGHSYGAWLALGFALRYPQRVSGLILSGVSPAFDYVPEVIANAQARDPVAAAVLVSGLSTPLGTDDALFARLWAGILPLYFHGPPRPEILAATRYSARAFETGMQCIQGWSVEPWIAELDLPILLLAGTSDYITPPAQAHRLAAHARAATVIELATSGHFPFVEQPAEYLAAIRAWFQAGRDGR